MYFVNCKRFAEQERTHSFLLFFYYLWLFWQRFNWFMDSFDKFEDNVNDSGIQEHAGTKLCAYLVHNLAS